MPAKYPYDINAESVQISDHHTISHVNELMRAILLNTSITEHLHQKNKLINYLDYSHILN